MTERFMKMPDVTAACGMSRATVYTKIAANEFPQPVKLGSRAIAFLESEIQAWIDSRIAASRGHGKAA